MKESGEYIVRWGLLVLVLAGLFPTSVQGLLFGGNKPDPALLEAGRIALEDGFYDLASDYFERIIKKGRSREMKAEAAIGLAQCLLGQGKPGEAKRLLTERGSWASSDEVLGAFQYWEAMAVLADKQSDDALARFGSFSDKHPTHWLRPSALRMEARILAGMKRFAEAQELFTRFLDDYPEHVESSDVLLDQARALEAAGMEEEAIGACRRLLNNYPLRESSFPGRLALGALLERRGQWEEALNVLELGATNEMFSVSLRYDAWAAIAALQSRRSNYTAEVEAWTVAESLATNDGVRAEALVRQAEARLKLGEIDEALIMLKSSVRLANNAERAAALQQYYAETLQKVGQHQLSVNAFQDFLEAFSLFGNVVEAHWGKAWSLWELGRYAEAGGAFENVMELTEDPARRVEAQFKIADAALAEGQYSLASERFASFVDAYPDHPLCTQAVIQQAEAMVQGGNAEDAQTVLEKLLSESQDASLHTRIELRRAQYYELAGEWDHAIQRYRRVIDNSVTKEHIVEAHYRRGVARYQLGRFEGALEDFAGIGERGDSVLLVEEAEYMRGWCLYMLGRDPEALAAYEQFIRDHEESELVSRVLFWLGEYHWNGGQFEGSETQFRTCAEQDPMGDLADQALFWAARAAVRQQAYRRANGYIADLVKGHGESVLLAEARLLQGDVLSELGQFDNAILAFEEIRKNWPESYLVDRAVGRIGDCQFTLGTEGSSGVQQLIRFDQALASYRMVVDSSTSSADLKLQAQYKIGRCLEKKSHSVEESEKAILVADSFEVYMHVVYGYAGQRDEGRWLEPIWFTRAAFAAAGMLEGQERWHEAVKVYEQVVKADVPAAAEANKRLKRIRIEHWVIF